ncbi:MAG: GIY-YIG nuclease family protein [Nitrospirota bacterium]
MDCFALFIDGSLDPVRKFGVGACLAVPVSFLDTSVASINKAEVADQLIFRRFADTSSTKLEVQSVIWAIENYMDESGKPGPVMLYVYSDSSCVAGLLRRRSALESKGFVSSRTNRPLRNAPLYRRFYELYDEYGFEVIKVAGHTSSGSRDAVQRVFSFVDREVRRRLKIWMSELETERIESLSGYERSLNPVSETSNGSWSVYVLKCRNNCLYIGLTNDINKRLKEHELGRGSKFVWSRRPFELVKIIHCKNAGEARSLECNLKRLKRNRKIEVLNLEIGPVK